MRTMLGAMMACAISVTARAEPAMNVTPTLLSRGTFPEFKVRAELDGIDFKARSEDDMDIVVRRHVYAAGGSTGWHTHPGPVFITIPDEGQEQGELTVYEYDGKACTRFVLRKGQGYVDSGHAHMIRNETSAPAVDVSVITAPVGQPFRKDVPVDELPDCGR